MFASMVGFFLFSIIGFLVLMGIIAGAAKLVQPQPVSVAENSILHLRLNTEIVDRGTENPADAFDFTTFTPTQALGLNDLLHNIRKAREDVNIKGIFLDLSIIPAGWATLSEIRTQLLDFRESGKFIIAYGEIMDQRAYYIASVSDKIFIAPEGIIDFRGLNAEVSFFSNLFEKIGVEPQLIRHGQYKSAAEPLIREDLSAENRQQISQYINSFWNSVVSDISASRQIEASELNTIADQFLTRTPEMALEKRIIDGIKFRDEVNEYILGRLGLTKDDEINLVTFAKYRRAPLPESMLPQRGQGKIAVIYGSGNMVVGEGTENNMGADRIAAAIQEARKDTNIRAIVLRLNSGGGASLAGEVILREAKLAAQAKPLVVSMGDFAASGAYYISAHATEIIANPKTLTGSIGVFAMVPNMENMFNDKLGITFDNVKTNEMADFGSVSRPLTIAEEQILQQLVDRVYSVFINHVAEGRELSVSFVDSIAQGQVWSGVDAKRLGLVDSFGGLNYAIERAAQLAEVETYRIVEFPVRKDFFERFVESMEMMETRFMQAKLGETWRIYQQVQSVGEYTGIQMRMSYDIAIE